MTWEVTNKKNPDFVAHNDGEYNLHYDNCSYVLTGPDILKVNSLPYHLIRKSIFEGHMSWNEIELKHSLK